MPPAFGRTQNVLITMLGAPTTTGVVTVMVNC
jgi:hypothetical protein